MLKGPKGDKGDPGPQGEQEPAGPQGEQGQGIQYGHLIVYVNVNNAGCYLTQSCDIGASNFNIRVSGNNQSPDLFQGSDTGTNVKLGFGSYGVKQDPFSYSYHTEK